MRSVWMRRWRVARMMAVMVLAAMVAGPGARAGAQEHWVGTWAASPVGANNPGGRFGVAASAAPAGASDAAVGAGGAAASSVTIAESGSTLREIVHVSIGGAALRVVLTNEFGTEPLLIGAATVGVRGEADGVAAGTVAAVTFGGRAAISIPPGALAVSDAVKMTVRPLSDLAVSVYVPEQTISRVTLHGFADQTSYLVVGNAVTAQAMAGATQISSWDFLKGVDVLAPAGSAAIVAFGDSITDGALSTKNTNARWPDVLARRLQADKATAGLGVLNQGIGGNRVLHDVTGPSALARFDRDVIAQAGVKYVVLMESINDIGHAADPVKPYDVVTAEDIIAGLAQLAARAHTHGIKVIGATLTPYGGAKYASPAGEAMRQAVNKWLRTSPEMDGVIDFEKVTRDPANAAMFLGAYDSGDHLHPKDAGYKAMGEAIDLKLFTR